MSVITQDCTPRHASVAPRSMSLFTRVVLAFRVWKERRQLAALDAHRLQDLGLTHMDAEAEATRPLWDVPASWRN
ncbi:DUF1127 domain-containing protein [Frigidibacter sp. ROC022]|uniref:DUF1127 domain-containing protein n=1 Tax=Frigidibacter sp. ROC022 TaxID=2971796 RepID=UPI00215A4AB3|nr:DUF1127 domain-containing protein [Frigidibacter sp. ROC022]MCR8726761.1 DUF1127 domain-containing protein [Frigidibacter sp. ROC022]